MASFNFRHRSRLIKNKSTQVEPWERSERVKDISSGGDGLMVELDGLSGLRQP